jgi:hypothetical protein
MAAKSNSMRTKRRFAALAFAGALASLLAACSPEVPANPTYTTDVKAILDAHCVRCHGAGDMLNAYPHGGSSNPTPRRCYLQRFGDEGDCSNVTNPDCKPGVGNTVCGPLISLYINTTPGSTLFMPPPPSDPLNDWEKEVIARWTTQGLKQQP